MRKTAHLPHGCDKQGRYATGRIPRTTTEAFGDAESAKWHDIPESSDNSPAWWLAAAALLVAFCAYAPLLAEVLQ